METRLKAIDWTFTEELPELTTEEAIDSVDFDSTISFEYRGKDLIADIKASINYSNHYVKGDYINPAEQWQEIIDTWVDITNLKDSDDEQFFLTRDELKAIEVELMDDLRTEY